MDIPVTREPTDHGLYRYTASCPKPGCRATKSSDSRSKAQGRMLNHVRDSHPELLRKPRGGTP